MRLVLLRHAKSAWPDVPDHERPLARRGRRDAPAVGRWLLRAELLPSQVLCSTARRARETWQLAQEEAGLSVPVRFEDTVYRASAAGLLDLVRQTSPGVATLLVIGHDPAIPGLALMLAGTGAGAGESAEGTGPERPGALDLMMTKFPTAATAVLMFTGTWPELSQGRAQLTDFVTPRDIPSWRPGG
jgi:phosphohistidine phosphatase